MSRAQVTARLIADQLGLDPVVIPGLIEINFGAMEGITIERLERDFPDLARQMSDPRNVDAAWPEGESRRGFHRRVFGTFQSILADFADQTVITVSHGGVIGSFLAQIQGLSADDPRVYVMANCSLTRLQVSAEGTTIALFNDIAHLAALDAQANGA